MARHLLTELNSEFYSVNVVFFHTDINKLIKAHTFRESVSDSEFSWTHAESFNIANSVPIHTVS